MADENQAVLEESEGKKKGGKKKIILIVIILLLGVAGFMGSKVLGGGGKAADGKTTTTKAPKVVLGVVHLDPVTVSIDQQAYVKLELSIEVVKRELKEGEKAPAWESLPEFPVDEFKNGEGQIARDEASKVLRRTTLAEVSAAGGTIALEKEITKEIKKAYEGSVSEVFYGDFLWQQ